MPDPAVFRLVCPRCGRAHIYAYLEGEDYRRNARTFARFGRGLCPDCTLLTDAEEWRAKFPRPPRTTQEDHALPLMVGDALRLLTEKQAAAVRVFLARGSWGKDAEGNKPSAAVLKAFRRAVNRLRRLGAFKDR